MYKWSFHTDEIVGGEGCLNFYPGIRLGEHACESRIMQEESSMDTVQGFWSLR